MSNQASDDFWRHQQPQNYDKPKFGATRHQSIDYGSGGVGTAATFSPQSRFAFGRSMSVNSEGASTASSSSPPYSPVDMSNDNNRKSSPLNIPSGRNRTSSFSSGYGPSYGQDYDAGRRRRSGAPNGSAREYDPYFIASPLSTSAPGFFRRSNSVSVGAVEYERQNSKQTGVGGGPNLGPIEEIGKINSFGDALKRSMGQLFSATKMPTPPKQSRESPTAFGNSIKDKTNGQMKDRVVSLLCDGALR